MKGYKMLIASFILASVPALGQFDRMGMGQVHLQSTTGSMYGEGYLRQAVKSYTRDLVSPNDGVVESAIAHTTFLKINEPQLDLREPCAIVAGLAESGRTSVIRYKAYLATIVFESPASFAGKLKAESTESNQYFSEIASMVQKSLLGQNLR